MNICVVTVYNTENCGSFWQAYALADVLKTMGHSVSFLYRSKRDTSQSFKVHLHEALAKLVKHNPKASLLVWKRSKNYKVAQKNFNVIKMSAPEFQNIDLFVIGSDTVWNFASPYFMRHRAKYTGGLFGPEKCITYAASSANTPLKIFENTDIFEPIGSLKAISVRDEYTQELVKKVTGRETKIVCDPTMLAPRQVFDKNARDIKDTNYVLIYHFASIKDEVKEEILSLKKSRGLKVISFGEHRSWCDKTIPYDPYMFVSYFKNASFVVTDTFHGTIFSILYEKNFVEYGNNKKKISDLLMSLRLVDSVKGSNLSLIDMFDRGLDYSFVNEEIKRLKAESMNYLEENLTEC